MRHVKIFKLKLQFTPNCWISSTFHLFLKRKSWDKVQFLWQCGQWPHIPLQAHTPSSNISKCFVEKTNKIVFRVSPPRKYNIISIWFYVMCIYLYIASFVWTRIIYKVLLLQTWCLCEMEYTVIRYGESSVRRKTRQSGGI